MSLLSRELYNTFFMKKFAILLIVLFSLPIVYAEDVKLTPKDPPGLGSGGIKDKSEILVPNAEIENGVINIETALASWGVSCDNYTYLVYRRQNSSSQYYDVNWSTNGSTFNEFNKMFYNISEAE